MSATRADLRARVTEFTATADATVDLALSDALDQINLTNWGETKGFVGQIYLAAHLLKVWTESATDSSSAASGPVVMRKDGDLQVSFSPGSISSVPFSDQALASTKWGQMYLDLRAQVFSVRTLATSP